MSTITQKSNAVHSATTFDTDIVVDLGCCSYQRGNQLEDSIQTLIKRFKPTVLFGFDPHPALREAVGQVYGTTVITSRRAAWTRDKWISLHVNGNCTHVRDDLTVRDRVRSIDIASWVAALPEAKIVLKVDIEGAEYIVLPHLIKRGLTGRFSRILVEWHTDRYANGYESDRESILARIQCPVEEWQ